MNSEGPVVVAPVAAIEEARRGFDLSGDILRRTPGPEVPNPALILGLLWNLLTFGILAGVGLCYRQRPAVHKRLLGGPLADRIHTGGADEREDKP